MPFVHPLDPEWEDIAPPAERTVAGKGFHYDGGFLFGSAAFAPGNLREENDAGPALGWLQELATTAVQIQYDGGCDEGFAYLRSAETAQGAMSREELLARWAAAGKTDGLPPLDRIVLPDRHPTPAERIEWAADQFADALAVRFLGSGYGTGEYEMFGEFTANLRTGQFVDLRDAEPREGVIQPEDPEEAAERAAIRAEAERLRRENAPPLVRLWRRLFGRGD